MKKSQFLFALMVVCFFAVSGCSGLVNKFAFYPDTQNIIPEEDLPDSIEEIFLTTTDKIDLQAYLVRNPDSDRILIFFHGNAGNISHRVSDILNLKKFGVNVLAVSYRGYGKSKGKPSEKGIYRDGEAAFIFAKEDLGFHSDNIIIFGRSIGTTVAVNVSQNRTIQGLILITPLTSGKAVAKESGFGVLSFLAGDSFNNLSKISNISCPTLIIHGTHDKVIPFSMAREIFSNISVEKHLVVIDGAGHNDLSQSDPKKYWGQIFKFINKIKT